MVAVPLVHARTFVDQLDTGHTRPGVFGCETENGHYQEYVVKYHSQLRANIICEFIAALLGHHLGLPIPPIAIVEIDPRLIAAIPFPETQALLAGDQGPHFGSQHQAGGYTQLPSGFSVPLTLIPQALDIFAFDMLIQNVDRSGRPGHGKSNVLFNGHQLWIIDHEMALNFERTVGPLPPPWELRGLPWVTYHVFYNQLTRYGKNHEISFASVVTRFKTVSDALLDEMAKAIPRSWYDPTNVDTIMSHFRTVRDNVQLFERGLLEALG